MCVENGCSKWATYNKEGEKKALYCMAHKKEGMVNVVSKTCLHSGCQKRPNYNKEGEKKALYCAEHKKEGMVNIVAKTCLHSGCKTRPSCNKEGEKKALYCAKHKKEGMVNIVSKTCLHPGCQKQPAYNKEGETKRLYCAEHKKEGMVDVVFKTCLHSGCKKKPNYNKEGEKKALYCAEHKKEGMVNVVSKTCKSEWCFTIINCFTKYDGYCLRCFIYHFPEKPVTRNYKTKEFAVLECVKNEFPHLTWTSDRAIDGGCSKRRPDLLVDLGTQVIIIETDENSHETYNCSCENKRIMLLSQDVGHRPIVFIRFNPDDYIKKGEVISSCWGLNKNGICVVKNSKKKEWSQRLNALVREISYWIQPENTTNKTIETIQLYYDDV